MTPTPCPQRDGCPSAPGGPSLRGGCVPARAQASRPVADLDAVFRERTHPATPRWRVPTVSPFDAQAVLESQLARLRAASGATRVSVWVHEASTRMVVPFRQSVADPAHATLEASPRAAVLLSRSP